jgi:hypothetical protein
MLKCCVCVFSLRRESPDMILADKPLISKAVLSHSLDDPTVHPWVGLNQMKELSLVPILWQKQKRRWDKSMSTYWLPNPIKRATTTRDIMHWSLKLVTTYTFESLRWKMYIVWHQREASSSLHWSVSYPWEVWTSDIPSGATAKIVRCAQRIPCISTQKKCLKPPTDVVIEDNIPLESELTYKCYPIKVLDQQDRTTQKTTIWFYKVHWNDHLEDEVTWEREDYLRSNYHDFLQSR